MDNRETVANLITLYSGQNRVVTIPSLYLELLGDYNTAVMLNQLIYWSDRSNRTDGFFFKSYKEWESEVYLSQYQVKKSIDKLKKLDLVETKLKKSYGVPTLHYKVDMEEISKWIIKKLDNRISRNLINDYEETSYSLTKNTTENTTENTNKVDDTGNNVTDELPEVTKSYTEKEKEKELELDTDTENKKRSGNDHITQSLSLIQENYFNQITPIKLESLTTEIEQLGENAAGIISVAIDYTKEKGKNLNYLTKVINNWADDNVKTVEDAKAKINGNSQKQSNSWISDELEKLRGEK